MERDKSKMLITNVSAPQTTDVEINRQSDMLGIQLSGTATTLNVQVLGQADPNAPFVVIGGFDQAFNVKQSMTSMGVYNFYIGTLTNIRVNVAQVSGGYVNVFIVSTRG